VSPTNPTLAANLSQIAEFAWLASPADFVASYPDPTLQTRALQLAALTGIRADARLDLATGILRTATPEGRAAALGLIAHVPGDRANQLLREALSDPHPEVRAAAARPLRDRHVPGVMGRLIELVSDPHPDVCTAAREALSEFSLENFLLKYDDLEETIRISTGALVLKVDARAIEKLVAELGSFNRQRRLRAIQAAETMGALPSIAYALVDRLDDDDHHVRAAAVEALQHCSGSDVRDALIAALGDRSPIVQRAAQASLVEWQAAQGAGEALRQVNARTG
jgi:HEAT repeat protein